MTIEIYRDSHLYELPDDLRGRLRSAILTKCHEHKHEHQDTSVSAEPKAQAPEKPV
jgi:hypothetical protein